MTDNDSEARPCHFPCLPEQNCIIKVNLGVKWQKPGQMSQIVIDVHVIVHMSYGKCWFKLIYGVNKTIKLPGIGLYFDFINVKYVT